MPALRQDRINKVPLVSSDQFIPLQTGSMDLLGEQVQYRFTLVRTISGSSPSFPTISKEEL
jgi:hypothetical protein